MSRVDYQHEAMREAHRNDEFRRWVSERAGTIRDRVTAFDVCRHFGVDLKLGDSHEEQICCPFHGDSDPSARIYPQQADSNSGVYCWVCQKRWDVFDLWREFSSNPDMKFTQVLFELEKAFGIVAPDGPSRELDAKPRGPSEEEKNVLMLLSVCERRMNVLRDACDLKAFFTIGKLLDHLHTQVRHKRIDLEEAEKRCHLILDKIGEKIRSRA